MSNALHKQLIKVKDNDTVNLGGNITAKCDRDKANSMDLYDEEKGFIVYKAGKEVGSISAYSNGEVVYFSEKKEKDIVVTSKNDLVSAIGN